MGFKIEGWGDIQRFLNDYQKGFDPQTFDDWARCVAEIAKTMCDDPACKLIKPLQQQQKDTRNPSLNFELADNKVAIDCMLKAIDQLQNQCPIHCNKSIKKSKSNLKPRKHDFRKLLLQKGW
jgi:hypothetical protein